MLILLLFLHSFSPITPSMNILVLIFSFPLISSFSNSYDSTTLFIPQEQAVHRFKEGETLESEDRIVVSTGWQGKSSSQINVTFYLGCDIPLLIQYVPDGRLINLWWRQNGKLKRTHTIFNIRENEVSNKLLLYLRVLDEYVNIVVNRVDDLADYQYRLSLPFDELTRITVHGEKATGSTIEVDHRGQNMREIAASSAKWKGPNFS